MIKKQGLHTAGAVKILLVSVTSNVINAVGINVNPVERVAVANPFSANNYSLTEVKQYQKLSVSYSLPLD